MKIFMYTIDRPREKCLFDLADIECFNCVDACIPPFLATQLLLSTSQPLFTSSKDSLPSSINAPSAQKIKSATAPATIVARGAVTKSVMSSSSRVQSDATFDSASWRNFWCPSISSNCCASTSVWLQASPPALMAVSLDNATLLYFRGCR